MESSSYSQRGVSSSKSDVHKAIENLDKGIYPGAFCKVLPDLLGAKKDHCVVMHADGAGTKSSLAYLYWKETGDLSVFKDIAIDSIVMNLDDLACVGALDNLVVSNTIGRNKFLIPAEVIQTVIEGYQEYLSLLSNYGLKINLSGGETADVGDLVRTIIIDSTLISRTKRTNIIDASNISPGNVIVGFASFGKCAWEKEYNSGIGSNGLTSARHDIFANKYAEKYPETFDPQIDPSITYCGNASLSDPLQNTGLNMGKAVLSPTRTYAPLIKKMRDDFGSLIYGLIHCSGGGQTKCKNFSTRIKYVKNNLFETPPLFDEIQKQTNRDWKEMMTIFNMGHRLEAYIDRDIVEAVIELSNSFGIEAKVIGHCVSSKRKDNELEIHYKGKVFKY